MTDTTRGSLEPYIKDEIVFYPHQVEGIRKLARMRSFLLADDMGLGKSLQALTVFGIDVYMGRAKSAIVVCPVTLKGNWMDEIEAFTRFESLELGKGYRKDGTPRALSKAERSEQLKAFAKIKKPKILVVNYEQVVSHLNELQKLKIDVAIFDEAHYLKNPRSKRTKASMNLVTPRSFLLTGSPLLNKVDELWSLLYRIDPTAFPNYWSFRQRYCVMGGFRNKEIVGVQNEQELTMRLQSVMLRRLKKDVLNLKEPHVIPRRVDLSSKQRQLYNEVLHEMKLTLPGDPNPMDIENGMTKFLRLKQICGTTATLLGPDEDHSYKLDLVVEDGMEILEGGNKIIVFTQFRDVQEAYRRRMEKTGYHVYELNGDVPQGERQDIVRRWSNHDGPAVISCMIQVAGIGLNMTAARHIQFIDKLFVPGLNKQAVDRAHRIGQDETQPVEVLEYITRDTVENRVEHILRTKSKLIDDVVETNNFKRMLYEEVMREEAARL